MHAVLQILSLSHPSLVLLVDGDDHGSVTEKTMEGCNLCRALGETQIGLPNAATFPLLQDPIAYRKYSASVNAARSRVPELF